MRTGRYRESLSAPRRGATRTGYLQLSAGQVKIAVLEGGKDPDEIAMVLHNTRTVEPRLRRIASLEVDTSAPVEQVLAALLDRLGLDGGRAPRPGPH